MKLLPTKYEVATVDFLNISIERRDLKKDSWAIVKSRFCLNRDLEFEYEPLPSSRDEDFINRTRFSLEEAKKILRKYIKENKL